MLHFTNNFENTGNNLQYLVTYILNGFTFFNLIVFYCCLLAVFSVITFQI